MTGTLRVTPEKLETTATDFGTQETKVATLTSQMITIVQGMSTVWTGEAQQSYLTRFNALEEDMNQIKNKIEEHVTDLKEMASIYRTAETTNTENVSALATDFIS